MRRLARPARSRSLTSPTVPWRGANWVDVLQRRSRLVAEEFNNGDDPDMKVLLQARRRRVHDGVVRSRLRFRRGAM